MATLATGYQTTAYSAASQGSAGGAIERPVGRLELSVGEFEQRNAHFGNLISRAHAICQRLHSEPPPGPPSAGQDKVSPVPNGLAGRIETASSTYGACLEALGHLLDRLEALT